MTWAALAVRTNTMTRASPTVESGGNESVRAFSKFEPGSSVAIFTWIEYATATWLRSRRAFSPLATWDRAWSWAAEIHDGLFSSSVQLHVHVIRAFPPFLTQR